MKKETRWQEKVGLAMMALCLLALAVLVPAYLLELRVNHLRLIGNEGCYIPVTGWAISINDYQQQWFIITDLGK